MNSFNNGRNHSSKLRNLLDGLGDEEGAQKRREMEEHPLYQEGYQNGWDNAWRECRAKFEREYNTAIRCLISALENRDDDI